MSAKKTVRILGVWLLLFVFALLCASAIAEGEVLEEYRHLVYLGTVLAMCAFAVAVCAVWLFLLARLQGKLRLVSRLSPDQQILSLCRLLGRYANPSFRSLISLNLVYAYLRAKENQKALALLSLQSPERCLFFDRKAYGTLFCVCAALYNDENTFRRFHREPVLPRQFPFLEEEVLARIAKWEEE